MALYVPVMLNCEHKRCLIIGGGAVAERKAKTLAEAGASIHMISPGLTGGLKTMAEESALTWTPREYQTGDLQGAFLAIAATSSPEVNESIAAEAREHGILVQVASSGESGDFISPAVLRRGRLTVAVSTSGAGPGAAARICRSLEEELGKEYEQYLDFLYDFRQTVKESVSSPEVRRRLLRKMIEIDILQDIRQGEFTPWSREDIVRWITYNLKYNQED